MDLDSPPVRIRAVEDLDVKFKTEKPQRHGEHREQAEREPQIYTDKAAKLLLLLSVSIRVHQWFQPLLRDLRVSVVKPESLIVEK